MRVAMVVPSLGFVGGIERHAHDLAASMAERGHRVTLVHGAAEGRDADAYARPFDRVLPMREAARLRGDVDVAYVHRANGVGELSPFEGLPVAVASHDHELTCVRSHRYLPLGLEPCHRPPGAACVVHGCVLVRDRDPSTRLPVALRSPFRLRTALRALSARALLVACSRYVAENLVRAGVPPRRVHVVHPIPPDDGEGPSPLPAEPRLLIAGNLLRGKGMDVAIEALTHLSGEVTLDVIGDGPSRAPLERLAGEVAPGRVSFHGWAAPGEMGERYAAARVVLVPSRWPEPFGMVGIEAMRRGRAVVGAAHGGIPEWLEPGRAGLLFAPGDPRDLARAVRTLLEDPGAGARAHAWAAERFPHRRLVDEVEAVLGRVIALHREAA